MADMGRTFSGAAVLTGHRVMLSSSGWTKNSTTRIRITEKVKIKVRQETCSSPKGMSATLVVGLNVTMRGASSSWVQPF
jgi:hypothetical protein